MTHTPPHLPIAPSRGPRRRTRPALAAALATALATALAVTGAAPALAAPTQPAPEPTPRPVPNKPLDEKFGAHDAALLAEAKAAGDPQVTLLIATEPGAAEDVATELEGLSGAWVGYTQDEIGYVRATVTTDAADAAVERAQGLSAVHAIDVNEVVPVPEPVPEPASGQARATAEQYPAPGPDTPATNPYQPSADIGSVDFVERHPSADGRGVTIGVLDTGVDLDHPALAETTTGEPKIVDWVTATDPVVDGDASWRPMLQAVSGEVFEYEGREYTAPPGDYFVNTFEEAIAIGELGGDLDRDGETDGSWAVLYDPEAGTVRVDLNDNGDFTDDPELRPYRENGDVAHFGTDDPDTELSEAVPFTVEIRQDVPLAGHPEAGAAGDTDRAGEERADFVSIGIVSGRHGTHVAGIAAANGLFGGEMNGAAPGAQVVSSRACSFAGGCTYTALFEGMIDLVANRGVDLVNVSIGGLPALNDGNNARARLYTELIDTYGVQLFISAGNDGPGVNTVSDPSVAEKVVSVGASISRETWAANYGSEVDFDYGMLPFSAAGPSASGDFKPTVSGPGASVNAIPTWQEGNPVPEAGYDLPPGYGMLQGTSMSSPQVAGAAALLLSGAAQRGTELDPATLRTALTSSAEPIPGAQAHEQGAGLVDTVAAWRLIQQGATAHEYAVSAPVDHQLSEFLAEPGTGSGIYDRESAPAPGESETYEVTLTRTTGPDRPLVHRLSLAQNHEDTFRLPGGRTVTLGLNEPVTVEVVAEPGSLGAHSAVLRVDDPRTRGVDAQVLATIVVPQELGEAPHEVTAAGTAQRNTTTSYFVTVPENAQSLQVALDGLAEGSQTRWIAISPWGTPSDNSSSITCYPHLDPPDQECRPDLRSYADPTPGVWELEVEARRTSPQLDNPYELTATAFDAAFEPATQTVEEAEVGVPAPVTWQVENALAAVAATPVGGDLGSARAERPTVADGAYHRSEVELGEGVSRFDVTIGDPTDVAADLDLAVYRDGELVDSSATGGSEESVSIADPEPGTYTVEVHGYSVPAGETEFAYRDVYVSPGLGEVTVAADGPIELETGASAEVAAEVTANAPAEAGRELFGEVRLETADSTVAGSGAVRIAEVVAAADR